MRGGRLSNRKEDGLRIVISLAIFLLVFQTGATGQNPWYELTAGPSVNFTTGNRNPSSFNFKILPQGGITGFFPFNKKFSLKTGLIYQNNSMNTSVSGIKNNDTPSITYNVTSKSTYHFLDVPLQLAMNMGRDPQGFWRIAFGMDYRLLLQAKSETNIHSYEHETLIEDKSIIWRPGISLEKSSNNGDFPGQEGSPLYFFTPSVRADITYQWQERLLITAFYQYGLQDFRVRTSDRSSINMHTTGISLGVLFW
jgi:hypothetical protein